MPSCSFWNSANASSGLSITINIVAFMQIRVELSSTPRVSMSLKLRVSSHHRPNAFSAMTSECCDSARTKEH